MFKLKFNKTMHCVNHRLLYLEICGGKSGEPQIFISRNLWGEKLEAMFNLKIQLNKLF